MTDDRRLLPLGRMAARAGVPSRWLRERAECGDVPALRCGRRWLFAPAAVLAALVELAERRPDAAEGRGGGR